MRLARISRRHRWSCDVETRINCFEGGWTRKRNKVETRSQEFRSHDSTNSLADTWSFFSALWVLLRDGLYQFRGTLEKSFLRLRRGSLNHFSRLIFRNKAGDGATWDEHHAEIDQDFPIGTLRLDSVLLRTSLIAAQVIRVNERNCGQISKRLKVIRNGCVGTRRYQVSTEMTTNDRLSLGIFLAVSGTKLDINDQMRVKAWLSVVFLEKKSRKSSNFRRQRSELQINMCGCALFAATNLTPLTSSLFVHCGKGKIMTFVSIFSSKLVLGNIFPSRVADTSSGDSQTSFADGAFSLVVR